MPVSDSSSLLSLVHYDIRGNNAYTVGYRVQDITKKSMLRFSKGIRNNDNQFDLPTGVSAVGARRGIGWKSFPLSCNWIASTKRGEGKGGIAFHGAHTDHEPRNMSQQFVASCPTFSRRSTNYASYGPTIIKAIFLKTHHLGGLVHRGANVQLSQHTIDSARRTTGPPETVHVPTAISAHPYSGNHFTALSSARSLDAPSTAGRHSTPPRMFSHPGSS